MERDLISFPLFFLQNKKEKGENKLETTKIKFRPVRGLSADILATEYNEGYVYFATDTKKIYMDSNGQAKIPMGGNSGIYYGTMKEDETPDTGQVEFIFSFSEIEGNEDPSRPNIPNIDDLILNIDGYFYRVTYVDTDNEELRTDRLNVAGSGGGGGSGSGPSVGSIQFDRLTPTPITVLYQSSYKIGFKVKAIDASGEETGSGTYTLFVKGIKKATGVARQGETYLDIGEYLELGENKVQVNVQMDIGEGSTVTRSKIWTITTTQLGIIWDYNETTINNSNEPFVIRWNVSGAGITKQTYIKIDGGNYLIKPTPTTSTGTQIYTIDDLSSYNIEHGAHTFEIYAEAEVDGNTIKTDSVYKSVIFSSGSSVPIISCSLFNTNLTQYDTVNIPIIVYVTGNLSTNEVILLEDNDTEHAIHEQYENGVQETWVYTPTKDGLHTLTIRCGVSEKNILIDVAKLNIDNEEVPGYAFRLKASELASNNVLKNWNSNGVTLSFSDNFDWINGGLKTAEYSSSGEVIDTKSYINVRAGTTMTINYALFNKSAKVNGKYFKIIFKATNCRDYDAQVLKCHDGRIGLIMRAQNAIYNSVEKTMNVPYCENNYLEFELDINKAANRVDRRYPYIYTWLDGVPMNAVEYSTNDSFVSNEYITIGSADCDVYVYLVKAYEAHLTDNEHLSNFIADAPSAAEMVARYDRNNILDENGVISYSKLAIANPNCVVHRLTIPRMTTTKNDKIDNCQYYQYKGTSDVSVQAEKVQTRVQGTSSAAYGLAAFNIDANFKGGLQDSNGNDFTYTDDNGNIIENYTGFWAMDEEAIPCNYFTIKVNVASSEGANNAINQDWYNRFQPYVSPNRRKTLNKKRKNRDCMEFYPGVLFIEDHNQVKDSTTGVENNVFSEIEGYTNNPYPRLYAVCNMGNSKKNVHVFHDTDNILECCIEVGDNQLPGQWMVVPQGCYEVDKTLIYVNLPNISANEYITGIDGKQYSHRALWEKALDEIYGFRYPDGWEDGISPMLQAGGEQAEAAEKMIQGWFDFVNWMAHCNPSPKYKTTLDENGELINNGKFEVIDGMLNFVITTTITTPEGNEKEVSTYYQAYYIDDSRIHQKATEYVEGTEYYIETEHVYGYTDEPLSEPVHYDNYVFKKNEYTSIYNWENNEYSDGIGGLIETCEGDYTHDTYEYRMAKMIHECEDHMVISSVIYHYLFIETHCMIDNVAKNTFWSSADGIHWDLTKNYDNDTADGNDNNGKFTRSYGMEPQDWLNKNTKVFNASQSVWLNFVIGLNESKQAMYIALESNGAWDYEAYLKRFNDWQSCIPERCWIEDYYRKYVRPYELYGAGTFLEMLEGGKKTRQRQQFEFYQAHYMSSKYYGKLCSSTPLVVRGTGKGIKGKIIPVKMYADCYLKIAFGSGTNPNYSLRVKRNEWINYQIGNDDANNAVINFYLAPFIQGLGRGEQNLSSVAPETIELGNATRLRYLTIGTENSADNESIKQIIFSNTTLLEEVYLGHLVATELSSLDLTSAINLLICDAQLSTFTGVSIADGAPIHTLLINNPTTINLSNLRNLKNFSIANYGRLQTILIDSIDNECVKTKEIVENAFATSESDEDIYDLSTYKLLNVKWQLENSDEISGDSIVLLDKLLSINTYEDPELGELSTAQSLSGILTIPASVYNNNNSINIYNKYSIEDKYPKLDIIFEGENAYLPTVNILDGDGRVHWSRKLKKGTNVDEEFLSTGPQGAYTFPYKDSTNSHEYTFQNQWEVYDAKNERVIATIENTLPLYAPASGITEDINIKPLFKEIQREFILRFYDYGDALLKEVTNAHYDEPLKNYYPDVIPYDLRNLNTSLYEAYDFKGYTFSKATNVLISDNQKVTGNSDLYAVFRHEEDIREVVHEDWFDFGEGVVSYNDPSVIKNYLTNTVSDLGWSITPKVRLTGKVTLPSKYNNYPVIKIHDFATFNGNKQLFTHIFVQPGESRLREISYTGTGQAIGTGGCFVDQTNLKYFDFSGNTIRYIGPQSFRRCTGLEINNLGDENSTALVYIGQQAFSGALNNNVDNFFIPSSVTGIDTGGLNYLDINAGAILQIGTANYLSELNLLPPFSPASSPSINTFTRFAQNQGNKLGSIVFYSKVYGALDNIVVNNLTVKDAFGSQYETISILKG